ncbi:MAG: DUF5362 family protein [Sporolactobacillus sp.]
MANDEDQNIQPNPSDDKLNASLNGQPIQELNHQLNEALETQDKGSVNPETPAAEESAPVVSENDRLLATFSTIASWGKFSGIMMIIFGAISAVTGLFAFIVGAAPGVLEVFLGVYLLRSSEAAADLKSGRDPNGQELVLDYYAKFLKMFGIILIIGLALLALGIILAIVGAFAFFQEMNNSYF